MFWVDSYPYPTVEDQLWENLHTHTQKKLNPQNKMVGSVQRVGQKSKPKKSWNRGKHVPAPQRPRRTM